MQYFFLDDTTAVLESKSSLIRIYSITTCSYSVKVWKNDRTTDINRRNLGAIAARLRQFPVDVSAHSIEIMQIFLFKVIGFIRVKLII